MGTDFVRLIKEKPAYKKYPKVAAVVNNVTAIMDYMCRNYSSAEISRYGLAKEAGEFIEYQYEEQKLERPVQQDRVFPLETVAIEEFNRKHEAGVENVTIHTGAFADEYARSFNALAVTIAYDIYFRNNAYNPSSEEGRKLLAHEMTHITQHEEGRITKNVRVKELEAEAEAAEEKEEYDPDPYVKLEIEGEIYRLRESEMRKQAKEIAMDIMKWLVEQKTVMGEKEYLRLLCGYEKWLHTTA